MTGSLRSRAGLFALAFITLHLPFLPASLEDLDSINFALGLRDFDVARHQPHPPGYPVFILAAKAANVVMPPEERALGLVSVVAGGLALFSLVLLFGLLAGTPGRAGSRVTMAALLAGACPLFWMTASRPLSDAAGLAVALAVQALALAARSPIALILTGGAAAVGAGIRSQVVWLTVPILVFAIVRQPPPERWRAAAAVASGYLVGALAWAIPLVVLTGGPSSYLRALFDQGAEDFSGVVMLWTTPTVRQLARALQHTFIAPWSFAPSAAVVLLSAVLGFGWLALRERRTLGLLAVAFGPYFVFHMLFQETATTRYALPLLVPVAFAAACGVALLPARIGAISVAAFASFNVFISVQATYAYSRVEAPAFQMLDHMRTAGRPPAPVLAMHRRDELDLRRPISWAGLPPLDRRLPAPPKREWLEVVKYWNAGGRQPVWFVADPPRSDLALFRRQRPPVRYRWPFNLPMVMGGVRPNEMDWYVIDPPDWYLGEGWALTPETAGVAREDGRGPGRGGIQGWIRRWPGPATLMLGGRNLTPVGPEAVVRVAVDGRHVHELTAPPGFFLGMIPLPLGSLSGPGDYATVTVSAHSLQPAMASSNTPPPASGPAVSEAASGSSGSGVIQPQSGLVDVAIEQFDAQPEGRVLFGYGEGWNELEYDPSTGRLWRWSTERATIRVKSGGRALTLRMDGEIEAAGSSHITIRVGDRVVSEHDVGRIFATSTQIPAAMLGEPESALVVETSAWYVPAETRWRSGDRRHLGLKVHSFQLTPASGPDRAASSRTGYRTLSATSFPPEAPPSTRR